MFKLLNPITAAFVFSVTTAAAAASSEAPVVDRNGTQSVPVGFADLEIATPTGQTALRERVDSAIDRLCNAPLPIDYTRRWTPRSLKRCETLTAEATEPQLQRLFERRGQVEITSLKIARTFAAR